MLGMGVENVIDRALPLPHLIIQDRGMCALVDDPLRIPQAARCSRPPHRLLSTFNGSNCLSGEDLQSLQQLCISLPRVHRLAISSEPRVPLELRPISIFPNTPSLRDLSIERASFSDLNVYPHLTRLGMSGSLGTLLEMLESRHQINHLTFHLVQSSSMIVAPPPSTHLHSLVLSGDLKSVEIALNYLTLPNLGRLEVHQSELGLKPSALLSFLKRSACTMIHLHELLDSPSLLPRLRTLSMRVDTEKFSHTVLAKILRKRRRAEAVHRVEFLTFRLYQDSYDDDGDTQWLPRRARDTRLLAAGVQIRVIWESEEGWPDQWVGESYFACVFGGNLDISGDPCETFP
ncbi:hypothetical protein B0H13DRAFT_2355775 [Mycena leptocephala]|nr:hypothetical protein B0H13DRAFT_2355775 [Mycena leptocephala]